LTPTGTRRFAALFHAMLSQQIYLPPSAYEAYFLSLAHTEEDLQVFAEALRDSLEVAAEQ
jgi:glutamate-1-semialdehyde 2,1-aminomutase